jgi:hypothetical protein
VSADKKAFETTAVVFDLLAGAAGPIEKTGGVGGVIAGIAGGLFALGAELLRAYGTEAPLEVKRMRSSLAEKRKREEEAREAARRAGVL